MSMGRRQKSQSPLWIAHDEISPGPGHRFYEKLNELLGSPPSTSSPTVRLRASASRLKVVSRGSVCPSSSRATSTAPTPAFPANTR
jgi:hypothetical protein